MDPIVKAIPVSQIHPSPHQARKAFDAENLGGLAESMKQEGLMNPVVVRKVEAGYELISGERRLRAAKLLGWHALEAKVIGTVSEAEAAAKGLIENIQREDLNTIEEAEGYKELNRLDPKYWTQNKIAQNCGKTQGHVSEFLRFLTLPEIVKGYIRRRILSAGHAVELIRVHKTSAQKALAHKIIKGKWSVMQTREAVDRRLGKKPIQKSEFRVQKKTEDPLSDMWDSLKKNPELASCGTWDVNYVREGWTFALPNTGSVSQADLARWFRAMAHALEIVAPGPRVSMGVPVSQNEFEIMARERENLRLPKTREEEAELMALAAKGLYGVYQWIYGADSLTARKVHGRTWAEWGVADPAAGARGIINALRKIQEASKF